MKTQLLKILAQQATPWPWKWFTSNSHNRLSSVPSGKDGDVVSAFKAVDGAACVSISHDDMAFIEAAHPGAVIELIERLEVADKDGREYAILAGTNAARAEKAERERDELRAEQAEHDEQIARMEGKFSLAKRALDSKTARCEKAETELRRRDAAAGEPVYQVGTDGHWYDCKQYIYQEAKERRDACRILYTAAPPAVLPELEQDVKNIIGLLSENEWAEHCTKSELGRKLEGEITRLHDLRAQQQKVVELPTSFTVIGENIRSQNNRCTADPIFCVFEKVPTPAAEGYNHTRIEWYDSDHDRDATPLQAARLEALFDGGRCDDNDYKCWRRLAMHDVDTFVTACFTFKGCEDYLAQNGHNLRQPFVYVTSAYRNDEHKAVREWLMQLAAAPAPGGDDVKQG